MNVYSVRKSNGRSSYVNAPTEQAAQATALKGEAKDVKVTRTTFVKKAR